MVTIEMTDVLINLIGLISQCIHILNYHIIHLQKVMLYNPNVYNFCQSYLNQAGKKKKKQKQDLNTNQNKKARVGPLTLLWQPSCTNAAPVYNLQTQMQHIH